MAGSRFRLESSASVRWAVICVTVLALGDVVPAGVGTVNYISPATNVNNGMISPAEARTVADGARLVAVAFSLASPAGLAAVVVLPSWRSRSKQLGILEYDILINCIKVPFTQKERDWRLYQTERRRTLHITKSTFQGGLSFHRKSCPSEFPLLSWRLILPAHWKGISLAVTHSLCMGRGRWDSFFVRGLAASTVYIPVLMKHKLQHGKYEKNMQIIGIRRIGSSHSLYKGRIELP